MISHLQNVELATTTASKRLANARARIAQGDTTNARMEIAAAEDALSVARRDLQLAAIEGESIGDAIDVFAQVWRKRNR